MGKDTLLLMVIAIGSGLCWWPAIIEPGIGFSAWIPFVIVALLIVLATALSEEGWLRQVVACVVGTFIGLCAGFIILPFTDSIGQSYWPFVAALITLASIPVALVAALAGRKLRVLNESHRRATCLGLAVCVAFGPVALALTPGIVASRTARNDRLAGERVRALKSAVQVTMAETGDPDRICDGQALKQHYSGPPFRDSDWEFLTSKNAGEPHYEHAKEDGYVFVVSCHEQGGYRIDALPVRGKADGTIKFCEDESGKAGCVAEQALW